MNTETIAPLLTTLFRELVDGSPEVSDRTYILNQGDIGLLASLDRLSATGASATRGGGASIAAHTDHLCYALSLMNRWSRGHPPPWPDMDFTASWRKNLVSDSEWQRLRATLRHEVDTWAEVLRSPREVDEAWAGWMVGSVAHVAYHMGAIRQIDRTTRGPSAEDEAEAQRSV